MNSRFLVRALLLVSMAIVVSGCIPSGQREVVVYCALDREFSETVFDEYEAESGVTVLAKYDAESTKTVGLVTSIITESERPRCDLFWNNEILHTMRLANQGLLDVYTSPAAESFPSDYVSSDGLWHGLAARARVLIVNTDRIPELDQRPDSILDLVDPAWKGQVAIAKPLFGTTATHAAVLFDSWGEDEAKKFFEQVKSSADVLSGNKQVALSVARGDHAFGITDTDDAIIEIEKGRPVVIVFPDQGEDQIGTLFIPNSLAIIKGGPHPEEARKLVDYLLSPDVETRLAEGPSAQFPVNPRVTVASRVQPEEPIRWMEVDFAGAADHWNEASTFLTELFQTAF